MSAHPEFVAKWDVARDEDGNPITITEAQLQAIWSALNVVDAVRAANDHRSIWSNGSAEPYKSRLLGRMLLEGKPPTKTKPPANTGAPWWPDLPGGDPFEHGVDVNGVALVSEVDDAYRT